jgi:hypothetical protein
VVIAAVSADVEVEEPLEPEGRDLHDRVASQVPGEDGLDHAGPSVQPLEQAEDARVGPSFGPDPIRAGREAPLERLEHGRQRVVGPARRHAHVLHDLQRDLRIGLPAHVYGVAAGGHAGHLGHCRGEDLPGHRPPGEQGAVHVPQDQPPDPTVHR